ncbi:MAG: GNAT family N-acetyltransferase [Acidobacteriota bacterium]|nr:GNAT family N-acetyltransferase [Acidobacteriota bacterium]
MAKVRLRPVTPEDEAFLYEVYKTTRAEEMAMVPWDEAQREAFLKMQFSAQQAHYRTYYSGTSHDIILSGTDMVGRLYVARERDAIRILDITILPEHRNKGLGTPLIKDLMAEAARARLPLTIHVESFNPSYRLFERLGFSKVKDDGFYQLMEWKSKDEGGRMK